MPQTFEWNLPTPKERTEDEKLAAFKKSGLYKDLSCAWLFLSLGTVGMKCAFSWLTLLKPMNQKHGLALCMDHEVGAGYNYAIKNMILGNPTFSTYKYLLCIEDDNIPPPNGVVHLLESIAGNPEFSAVSGMYWTKTDPPIPMIYGNPADPMDAIPQIPQDETLQECNACGMGFTVFNMDIFRDERLSPGEWFQTVSEFDKEAKGGIRMTQDLYFFLKARQLGYRFAVDTSVRVGHYDRASNIIF